MDAPFAVHPNDERRAKETIDMMKADHLTWDEMAALFRAYIDENCTPAKRDRQLERVGERLAEWAL